MRAIVSPDEIEAAHDAFIRALDESKKVFEMPLSDGIDSLADVRAIVEDVTMNETMERTSETRRALQSIAAANDVTAILNCE